MIVPKQPVIYLPINNIQIASYLILIMQQELKDQLVGIFTHLPPKIPTFVAFQNQNIRQIDENGQLQRVFMAFAAYISIESAQSQYPLTIVVTASHNPPNYNGLKLQSKGSLQTIKVRELQQIMNSQEKFLELVQRLQLNQSSKKIDFFIGRDTRPTSKRLAQILIDTLRLLRCKVADLGQGCTPEIVSLSIYLSQNQVQNDSQKIETLSQLYFQTVKLHFEQAVALISLEIGKQWQKKTIYFDFANGVGAISFKKYQFLKEYFEIKKANYQNFAQPNVECGAEWIYTHRINLPNFSSYPVADFYVWFDGDADRIVMKGRDENALIQGQDFNICLFLWLEELVKALKLQLRMGCVGNITTNAGLVKYFDSLKIQYLEVPVGMINLYKAAHRFDICVFFEPNGHGSIYFSPGVVQKLQALKEKNWQAKLLILIHGLTRNNSRGYAIHNFLVLQLYFHHKQTYNAFLFKKVYQVFISYHLSKPELFLNGSEGAKLLIEPLQLVAKINQIRKKYTQLTIKVRKSLTAAILRLSIQGQQKICKECEPIIQQLIKQYA